MEFFNANKRIIWAAILGIVIGNLLNAFLSGWASWVVYGVVAGGALLVTDMTMPYFDKIIDFVTSKVKKDKS